MLSRPRGARAEKLQSEDQQEDREDPLAALGNPSPAQCSPLDGGVFRGLAGASSLLP